MAAQVTSLQNSRLKAMVVPREHGAWGMLLVPLVTGAVAAGSGRFNLAALVLYTVAALALFWMRTPVEAWMGTTAIKAQTEEERATVLRVAILLGLVAAAAIAALFAMGLWKGLLIVGAIAAAAFAAQAVVKRAGRAGRMPAQVIGAIGLTSTAAGAYYVASGALNQTALALWAANWMFAGDQVHFVQVRIRGGKLKGLGEKLRQAPGFLVGQVLLLALVAGLSWYGAFPKLAWLAFVPALARGFAWFVRGAEPLDVHKLGFAELRQAILFGVLVSAAFRL